MHNSLGRGFHKPFGSSASSARILSETPMPLFLHELLQQDKGLGFGQPPLDNLVIQVGLQGIRPNLEPGPPFPAHVLVPLDYGVGCFRHIVNPQSRKARLAGKAPALASPAKAATACWLREPLRRVGKYGPRLLQPLEEEHSIVSRRDCFLFVSHGCTSPGPLTSALLQPGSWQCCRAQRRARPSTRWFADRWDP